LIRAVQFGFGSFALLDAVSIPRDAFTAIFAISRSAGWIAHALEQQNTGRMIRPASHYVGPKVE
jgi:citrate synthase